jgi:hypothetical protein
VTIYDGTAQADGAPGISTLGASSGEELGARATQAFLDSPIPALARAGDVARLRLNDENMGSQYQRLLNGEDLNQVLDNPKPAPVVPMDEARARVKAAGLDLTLGDQDSIPQPALDLMMGRARAERDRQATMTRGPGGVVQGALDVGTSLFVPALDPLNLAAFAIPVLGEARYGKMLADSGSSFLPRAGLGLAVGAQKGAIGAAALAPLEAYAKTQEGQDYHLSDALESMLMSAGTMGLLHGGAGEVGRLFAGGPNVAGTHVTADHLASEGLREEELPGVAPSGSKPQAELGSAPIADLPPQAKEDVLRGSIAALVEDKPVQAAEHIAAAAEQDPRIAESVPLIEAFHGSPHDFDRFSSEKIGVGEGAQSYGHGLYFAQEPEVAENYRRSLTRAGEVSPAALADPELGPQLQEARADYERLYRRAAEAINSESELAFSEHWQEPEVAAELHRRSQVASEIQNHVGGALRRLETLEREAHEKYPAGATYKVHIAADREHFLDWDKPLSEQSEHVKAALQKAHPDLRAAVEKNLEEEDPRLPEERGGIQDSATGERLYQALVKLSGADNAPEAVARALHEAGIPGVKYLDQGSRAAGEGTRNFVVFDDKLIRITHKNGKEVGLDEMKASRPESVPGPAPGTLRTGRPAVDALLADPVVANAIANGSVNRANDVPYEAGASKGNDPTTNLDHHLPRVAELANGQSFDPAVPAKIHEQVEKVAMERLIAKEKEHLGRELTQKEINRIYEIAHHEYAEVAEDAWYRQQGLDLKEVNAWWAKQDKITEHENPKNPPPNLYTKPYPHNEVEGVKHEPSGSAMEWPTSTDVEGTKSANAGEGGNAAPARSPAAGPEKAFRDLASAKASHEEPEAIEAERSAQALPDPSSIEKPADDSAPIGGAKESAAARAEREAAEAWKAIEPYLADKDRAAFNETLAKIDAESADYQNIVREGAACLAAAVA